jgi:hypothetical protein
MILFSPAQRARRDEKCDDVVLLAGRMRQFIDMNALKNFMAISLALCCGPAWLRAADPAPRAFIDGTGGGWKALKKADFVDVNCQPETWTETNGTIYCTGSPVGVMRTTIIHTNFELVAQWRHLKSGGNSGIFVWATPESIAELEKGTGKRRLPTGIEVQILDHGFAEQYEQKNKKKGDWFTTNGDVFPTGSTRMDPFPPVSPNGSRSFPSKNLSKGVGEWNHYYVRAINGEIRLWVNGEEVSGGNNCRPANGYLCLESEGAPVEFKEIRIRELP